MPTAAENRLLRQFPNVALPVLQHLLRVFGGDHDATSEQLRTMTAADIAQLAASLQEGPITAAQRERVAQFQAIASVRSERQAARILTLNGWDLEAALNAFFSGACENIDPEPQAPAGATRQWGQLFEQYRAAGVQEGASDTTELMEGAALSAFQADLDPADEDGYCLFLVAFLVQAQNPMSFSRSEFVDGLAAAGIGSLADLRRRVPDLRRQLQQPGPFRDFYRFCFTWMRASAAAKVLDCEAACDLWTLLLRGRYALLPQWVAYVRDHHKKAITRDVWHQFLEFAELRPDFSDYDEDGAWPVLFDDFVAHMRPPKAES